MRTTHIPDVISFIAICGLDGVGKSKLVSFLLDEQRDPRFRLIPSITTRKPRTLDEANSGEYVFATETFFDSQRAEKKFAWDVEVGGKKYGTLKKDIDAVLDSPGQTGILIITPATVAKLEEYVGYKHLVLPFFIHASREIILYRLIKRERLSNTDAEKRASRCLNHHNEARETGIRFAEIDNNNSVQEMATQFYSACNAFFHEHAP